MPDQDALTVTVEVRIDARGGPAGFGNMTIREDFRLPVAGFTELAAILGQFHDLAQKVKAADD